MRLRNIPGAKAAIEESRYVVQDPAAQKGRWASRFANGRPIHLEVGMGKGQFLMEMARQHQEINYIGAERYDSVLLRALQKREKEEEELENLLFLCEDARRLPEIFEKGELSGVYLNFSDPWPKARHASRRLTSRDFLARYSAVLPEGAFLEFKTDNRALFDFSLQEIRETPYFFLEAYTYDLHRQPQMCRGNVMTEYEEKFSSLGHPICKLTARRAGESA